MEGRPRRCPDCAEGLLEGNGKCGRCNGTGINTQLNSAQPKCSYCAGTGVCATCGGQGYYPPQDNGNIQTLFG